jgi:hypothetical protein
MDVTADDHRGPVHASAADRHEGVELMSSTPSGTPDPRLASSWCREGVAHDHGACGSLWNPRDPEHVKRAVEWADDKARARLAERQNLRVAAQYLLDPYLCNWDLSVASALAAWLEAAAAELPVDTHAVATATALLASFGVDPDSSRG